jgi:hypothetical protein
VIVALIGLIVLAIYPNFVRGLFVAAFLAGMLALGGHAPADELGGRCHVVESLMRVSVVRVFETEGGGI